MTPDEYEARLRGAVFCYYNALPCVSTAHDHGDGFADDLDAYTDWLRVRATAEVEYCQSPDEKCETDSFAYKGRWCDVCDAKRRMAEILAAAEVTG